MRAFKRSFKIKRCKRCGKEFKAEAPNQEYCSKACRSPKQVKGKCAYCGKEIYTGRKRKYCSYECAIKARGEKVMSNPFQGNSTGTTGAISELRVAIDLLSKGFDVFRALSPSCSCDLAIVKDAKMLKIEVRTIHKNAKGKLCKTASNNKADCFAWVTPDEIIYDPGLNI